jgi:tetratricopeptide (TPR) repeat protein
MNEIHLKYRDRGLVVIGQDVWEENPSEAEKFVKKMGSRMTYRVVLDEGGRDGVMAKTWLTASGQQGIPSAILVGKDGRVAWIGYGMELQESTIESVLAGTYDIQKAAASQSAKRKYEADLEGALESKNWDKALALLEENRKTFTAEDWEALPGMAYATYKLQALVGKRDFAGVNRTAAEVADAHPKAVDLQAGLAWMLSEDPGIENRDLELAERLASRANSVSKGTNSMAVMALATVLGKRGKHEAALALQEKALESATDEDQKDRLRSQVTKARFDLCVTRKDAEGAYRVLKEDLARHPENAMLHNEYAWRILTTAGLEPRDSALAGKLAMKAREIDKGDNPLILDTLALALFDLGKKDEAIKMAEIAVAGVEKNPDLKRNFSARLESYKAGKRPTNLE